MIKQTRVTVASKSQPLPMGKGRHANLDEAKIPNPAFKGSGAGIPELNGAHGNNAPRKLAYGN